jgi:hypothetical protein
MKNKRIQLDDLKRDVPFEVPEGYFEELPSIIQSRIPAVPERKPLISWSWQRSVALTGALSLIVLLIWVTFPARQGPLGSEPLSEVSDAAILDYLAQENISYYDLSENSVVQTAFETDSTVLNYLDGVDAEYLRTQIDESLLEETI